MDRSEYMTVDADYWHSRGEDDERAKIVAWLRAQDRLATIDLERILANDIEAGEHLK